MRREVTHLVVATGLMLGPLAYAMTLAPEVVICEAEVEPAPVGRVQAQVARPAADPAPQAPETEEPAPQAPETEAADPEPPRSLQGRLAFAFVNEAGLLLSTEADAAWGKGRLRAHAGPGEYRAAKRANARTVPEALWRHRGRTFDLYNAYGKVCTARLGQLSVLAQHNGPSLYEVFHGDEQDADYDAFEAREHSSKSVRAAVWAGGEAAGLWLTAALVSDEDCDGAVWARDGDLPPPVVLRPSDDPSTVSARRLAAHESSEALAELKSRYETWYGELGDQAEFYEDWGSLIVLHPAKVRTWLDADGVARFADLEFGAEGGLCGEGFGTKLTSWDRVTKDRVTEDRFEPTDHPARPVAVFDADQDGKFELLYRDDEYGWITALTSETLGSTWSVEELWICPC